MLESTFHEDWDEIGSNRTKKGLLVLKSTIFSKLTGCQWVNIFHLMSTCTGIFVSCFSFLLLLFFCEYLWLNIQWNPDFSNTRLFETPDFSNHKSFPLDLLQSITVILRPIFRMLDFSN